MNVVSIVRSTTRWVALQSALFRKFCGVTPIFINHGPNHDAMQGDFDRLGVTAHRIPECKDYNPSISHSFALEWVCEHYLRRSDESLCIVDMDLFPMRPVDLDEFLGEHHAAGCQVMPDPADWHLWPGLLFINQTAPDRAAIRLGACLLPNGRWIDSGGELLFWLREHGRIVKFLPDRPLRDTDLPETLRAEYREDYVFEVKAEGFFHLHGATNWMGLPRDLHEARENLAERFLNELLA